MMPRGCVCDTPPTEHETMVEEREIPEPEYLADLEKGLNEIAEKIARSGLNIAEIARSTGCHWGTVYNAANGVQIRFDNARRLVYFLDRWNSNNLPYTPPPRPLQK